MTGKYTYTNFEIFFHNFKVHKSNVSWCHVTWNMLQIESNFKHGSQSLRVAVWTSTYYSAAGRFWHLMRTKYSHCSNLSFLIPSSNVLIMSKSYIKIPPNSVLNEGRLISTIDWLPLNLTVQHHVCVAGIKVLCAFLAVVQKWKMATVARTRSSQTLDHSCERVDGSLLRSTDMGKALSLTSPILSLYSEINYDYVTAH